MPSTYPKYFDLNIGKVLEHLETEDSLKEIISNGLDEHILSKSKRDIKIYKNDNNKWCIRDYGRGIKSSNFKFDINNDKQDNHDIIGMYGYGLKDAIGNLFHKDIKFKICTKSYIFTTIMRPKEDFPDEETLHMEIIKNTTYEINKGTEFVFDNLTLENITKAKEKFMKFLNPKILFELNDYKIFKLNSFQSIFVNGVEVHKNTGFHFSYDIKSSEDIKRCFNRDRKQLDLQSLKPHIIKVLKKIDIYNKQNENKQKNNEDEDNEGDEKDNDEDKQEDNELFTYVQDILKTKTEFLQEFNQIDVIRNIILQINNENKYVFVGTKEKITKQIKEKILEDNKQIFLLNDDWVKTKFRVKYVKDLYHYNGFDENIHINTLINYISLPKKLDIKEYISNLLNPIERLFTLPELLKNKLLNIEVVNTNNDSDNSESDDDNDNYDNNDDNNIDKLNKYGYNFDEETLKISQKYIDERNKKELFVILFRYIVNNIDDDSIKKLAENRRGWFW
jgi:hypothetical protein